MIEMKVRGIAVDPGLKIPMVILTDEEEKRYLPIPIGVAEATAIFIQLNEQVIARPMTHDLLKNIIDALGAKVAKVLVNDIHQNTFFARIFLEIPESRLKSMRSTPGPRTPSLWRFGPVPPFSWRKRWWSTPPSWTRKSTRKK